MLSKNSLEVINTTTTTEQPVQEPGWQTIAFNGIRDGSWAVLLFGALTYTALRGVVGRYLDKHMSLLDTMKDSLGKNANSLEDLSKAEVQQNVALQKQGDALERQVQAVAAQQQAILNIDARQKEVVTRSMTMLENNSVRLDTLTSASTAAVQEHRFISDRLAELKDLSENHQQELVEKLQVIEDLYHASEEATGNKGKLRNFWSGNNGYRK